MADIKQIDKNFENKETTKELKYYNPKECQELSVYGLPWFPKDHLFIRAPKEKVEMIKGLAEGLYSLVEQPAGSMIAFYTDSTTFKIEVEMGGNFHMAHMAFTGQGGCDLYLGSNPADLAFFRCASFPINNLKYSFTYYENIEKKMRLHLINLPLYASVNEIQIGLDENAVVKPATLFTKGKVVCYGTSITQGGCASRPGMCYTNILSRMMDYEFVNFGFSGNGRGQKEIAEMLASIDNVKMYILDYEANVTLQMMQNTLETFINTLRKSYPTVPILVLSKIMMPNEHHFETNGINERKLYSYQKRIVRIHQKEDNNIYFLDGHKLIGPQDLEMTVDGAHPTDLGFYFMSTRLNKYLKKILK